MIVITLAGTPKGKGRPRFAGHVFTPSNTRDYEKSLALEAKISMGNASPIEGPLFVEILAVFDIPLSWGVNKKRLALGGKIFPTSKPDIDNIMKCIDALNNIVWKDDSQIVSSKIDKRYGKSPRLEISVYRMEVV